MGLGLAISKAMIDAAPRHVLKCPKPNRTMELSIHRAPAAVIASYFWRFLPSPMFANIPLSLLQNI